ncbi:MAG: hypothetical protein H6Q69_2059 [Firmicutes bacterium]|nr:hypothetical protein [Bacillota bacterium]
MKKGFFHFIDENCMIKIGGHTTTEDADFITE